MDISTLSIVELKALLFDLGQEAQRIQANANAVMAELQKKVKEAEPKVDGEKAS